VAAALPAGALDVTGRLSLGGTLGLLSRAALFVGNDSGPRHLAVAAGTPTVGVFWVGNAISFGSLTGSRHRMAVSFRSDCPECGEPQVTRRCAHDVSFVADVPVEDVLRPAVELLDA
jgi:ADP-heptose:LPS heptosyltransferase